MRLVTLLTLLVLMSSCVPKPEGGVHIRYAIWGSIEQQAIEEAIVRAFEKENPDVKVDIVSISATRYAEKVQAMMVGHVAPDVLMVEMGQYLEWAARGALLDVTKDVRSMTESEPLMPLPKKAFERNGKFFAFPANCSGLAMFYNIDALRAAGIDPAELKTWDDVCRVAPRLSRITGNASAPTDYAFLMPPPLMIFWEYGADLFDDPVKPTRVTVMTPQARAYVEFLRKVYAAGYAVPPDVSVDQGTYQLFRDGKVALYCDGRYRTPNFVGKTNFAWDVMPVPAGPACRVTQHGGTGLAVSRDSRHSDLARRFIRFYMSKEGMKIAMTGGRYVPVYRDLALGPEFLNLRPPDHIRVFAGTMEENASRIATYCPGSSRVRDMFSGRMEQAVAEPGRPVDEILQGLEQDLKRWLAHEKEHGLL